MVKPTRSAEDDIYTFVTNNHVIGDLSDDNVKRYLLEFKSVPGMKPFQLGRESTGFKWTDKDIDATIIEIKLSSDARFLNLGTRFLEVGNVIPGTPGAVIGHPEGGQPSFDHGIISQIINEYQVLHRSSTKPGNSGSPLVSLEGQAVGIHCGSYNADNNAAVSLDFVLKRFILEREDYNSNDKKGCNFYIRNSFIKLLFENEYTTYTLF